jgi:hypothetical protein
MDEIRSKQATNKSSRGKILDQVKALNDGIAKKVCHSKISLQL